MLFFIIIVSKVLNLLNQPIYLNKLFFLNYFLKILLKIGYFYKSQNLITI